MSKYHVHPSTGESNPCHAQSGNCPFVNSDGSAREHYDTIEEARVASEKEQESQHGLFVKRETSDNSSLPDIDNDSDVYETDLSNDLIVDSFENLGLQYADPELADKTVERLALMEKINEAAAVAEFKEGDLTFIAMKKQQIKAYNDLIDVSKDNSLTPEERFHKIAKMADDERWEMGAAGDTDLYRYNMAKMKYDTIAGTVEESYERVEQFDNFQKDNEYFEDNRDKLKLYGFQGKDGAHTAKGALKDLADSKLSDPNEGIYSAADRADIPKFAYTRAKNSNRLSQIASGEYPDHVKWESINTHVDGLRNDYQELRQQHESYVNSGENADHVKGVALGDARNKAEYLYNDAVVKVSKAVSRQQDRDFAARNMVTMDKIGMRETVQRGNLGHAVSALRGSDYVKEDDMIHRGYSKSDANTAADAHNTVIEIANKNGSRDKVIQEMSSYVSEVENIEDTRERNIKLKAIRDFTGDSVRSKDVADSLGSSEKVFNNPERLSAAVDGMKKWSENVNPQDDAQTLKVKSTLRDMDTSDYDGKRNAVFTIADMARSKSSSVSTAFVSAVNRPNEFYEQNGGKLGFWERVTGKRSKFPSLSDD